MSINQSASVSRGFIDVYCDYHLSPWFERCVPTPHMHGALCVLVVAIRNSFFFSLFFAGLPHLPQKVLNSFLKEHFCSEYTTPLFESFYLFSYYLWNENVWKWEYSFIIYFYSILALESWKRLFIRMPIDRFDWYTAPRIYKGRIDGDSYYTM